MSYIHLNMFTTQPNYWKMYKNWIATSKWQSDKVEIAATVKHSHRKQCVSNIENEFYLQRYIIRSDRMKLSFPHTKFSCERSNGRVSFWIIYGMIHYIINKFCSLLFSFRKIIFHFQCTSLVNAFKYRTKIESGALKFDRCGVLSPRSFFRFQEIAFELSLSFGSKFPTRYSGNKKSPAFEHAAQNLETCTLHAFNCACLFWSKIGWL